MNDELEALREVVQTLRSPQGCPWDRVQTAASLRGHLLEEAYEVVDAIDQKDDELLAVELGDLLFQIVFLSELAQERDAFTLNDVIRQVREKMIRRHPNVYVSRDDSDNGFMWERMKQDENEVLESVMANLPEAMPALKKTDKLFGRAKRMGFSTAVSDDMIQNCLNTFLNAQDVEAKEHLFAALLLALVSRVEGFDPEIALNRKTVQLQKRFIKKEEGDALLYTKLNSEEKKAFWRDVFLKDFV